MARPIAIFFGVVLAIYVALNHSVVREVYICQGDLTSAGLAQSKTAYFAIDRYRWWIFWADDDGNAHLELSDEYPKLYSGVDESLTQWFFYLGGIRGIPDGTFSALSNSLQFRLGGDTFYKGTCARTVEH